MFSLNYKKISDIGMIILLVVSIVGFIVNVITINLFDLNLGENILFLLLESLVAIFFVVFCIIKMLVDKMRLFWAMLLLLTIVTTVIISLLSHHVSTTDSIYTAKTMLDIVSITAENLGELIMAFWWLILIFYAIAYIISKVMSKKLFAEGGCWDDENQSR